MTVVTAVLELAAVGLLVYNKAQLDSLPEQLDVLIAQPMVEEELDVVLPEDPRSFSTASGGILIGSGEVPTETSGFRPDGRSGGGIDGSSGGEDAAGKSGTVDVTGKTGVGTVEGTVGNETASGTEVTASSSNGGNGSTDTPQETTRMPVNGTTISSATPPPHTSQSLNSTKPSDIPPAAVEVVESRQAATSITVRPENDTSTQPSDPFPDSTSDTSTDLSNLSPQTSSPTTIMPETTNSSTTVSQRTSRRRRHSEEDWQESDEDWNDRTEEVIDHWNVTDCFLSPDDRDNSHCNSQLEHNLQVRPPFETPTV